MKIKLCTKRSKIKETEIELVITASPAASKTCRAHHISPTRALAETTSSKLNTRIVNKTKMKHRIATISKKRKRSSPKLKLFFRPKLGDLQKEKKEKGLHRNSVTFPDQLWVSSRKKIHFCGPNNSKSFTISASQSHWGSVFIFGAKIGLKSTKNVIFCILFRPMRGLQPPLATLLHVNGDHQITYCESHDVTSP